MMREVDYYIAEDNRIPDNHSKNSDALNETETLLNVTCPLDPASGQQDPGSVFFCITVSGGATSPLKKPFQRIRFKICQLADNKDKKRNTKSQWFSLSVNVRQSMLEGQF